MLRKAERRTQRRKTHPPALRIPQIAKHFGVSSCTVYQWIEEGTIPERYVRRLSGLAKEDMRVDRDAVVHLEHYRDSVKSKANGLLRELH
jgi:predicted DNA-binding transcriptional regulator AlpA